MWEKNEITWMKVLHAHWRKNTIEIEWIGIINYYFYWTISEAQTWMLAWPLRRERRPSLNQRPHSVPSVAQKTWTTKSSVPKTSCPSYWLPISWNFLQVEHYCLSLLFWLSCPVAEGSFLGPIWVTMWAHHCWAEPRSLMQEATLPELNTQRL